MLPFQKGFPMSGGTTEINRDTPYFATGTHDRGTSTTLHDSGSDFKSCGVQVGAYIENDTQSTNSLIATVTEDEITTDDGISWNNGDTYYIYRTAAKGSVISTNWVDLSRGWRTPMWELQEGWRAEDLDIDRDQPGRVFGPGQPSKDH